MNSAPRLALQLGGFILRRLTPRAPVFRLWIDITSRCNLRCRFCVQPLLPKDQRRDMDPAILENLAEQVGNLGCEINLFHRGEPLLHPDLGQWIARFKAGGNMVRVHTNATLLSQEKVNDLLQNPPDLLTCSVDTLDSAAYAAARRGADLAKVLSGMERLLIEKWKRKLTRPKVALLLMGRQIWGERARIQLERFKEMGLDRVVWRAEHNWGGALGDAPNERLRDKPQGIGGNQLPFAESCGALDPRQNKRRPNVCTFPWYGLAVLSDGRVSPCPQDFLGRISLGRADRQSLSEIWQGQAAQNLRRAHRSHRLEDFPVCLACDRIRRPTILGIPTEHLKNFLSESIVGPRGRD